VPRALGALDAAGTFSLVGLTTNQYDKNNIRSGTTDGRGNYWAAGATDGTFYFGNGTPATVQLNVASTRVVQAFGGDLYFSSSSGNPGILKINGAPVTKASDNAFPSVLITEGTVPSTPAAGKQRLYIDSTTHVVKVVNSSGAAWVNVR
jgi:hypothetical protein